MSVTVGPPERSGTREAREMGLLVARASIRATIFTTVRSPYFHVFVFASFAPGPWACALLYAGALALAVPLASLAQSKFERIATFEVISNLCAGLPLTDPCYDQEHSAEIVVSTPDGKTLLYSDSLGRTVGFIDISDPAAPKADGFIELDGEPTSVAVVRNFAVVGLNTSEDFINVGGELVVIDPATRNVVRRIDLRGQPDSVAVSPNNRFIAVAIENERNEDLCVGGTRNGEEVSGGACRAGGGQLGVVGQLPAGYVVIVDVIGRGPANWATRRVNVTGLAEIAPADPEPEFVSINSANVAVVTLQENNHLVLIHLPTGTVIDHFPAGKVDLKEIDTVEERLIPYDSSLSGVPREADSVVRLPPFQFATADEGDMVGGGRGFTIYNTNGQVVYTSGSELEDLTKKIGHYPEDRSANKGNEPEGIEFGLYKGRRLLFVGSERSSVIFVYELKGATGLPELLQILPAGVAPEGMKAIPSRDLLVVSAEADSREDTLRSAISIYRLGGRGTYPTIQSANGPNGKPIPWAALSALAADRVNPDKAWTVWYSFFAESRIFEIDLAREIPTIVRAIPLIYQGKPVSGDLGGIVQRIGGGFYVASEGSGSCNAQGCDAVRFPNQVFRVDPFGVVTKIINLPASVNALQRNNGFKGLTVVGAPGAEVIYVAFQRQWPLGDPPGHCRIGRYDVEADEWTFYYYPLDTPTSPNGGWAGLSEIIHLGGTRFAVIERDNQAGQDATIKKIYTFNTAGVTPQSQDNLVVDPAEQGFPLLSKTEAYDLLPVLKSVNGQVKEKVEGLMIDGRGNTWINTDNDGVDDSNGETQQINLGPVL